MVRHDPEAKVMPSHALRSQLAYANLRGIMPDNA